MAKDFFDTFGSTGMKEDVRDLITVISPDETPAMSMLADSQANGRLHEWLTIPLPTGADNKQTEGVTYTFTSGNAETRIINYTQIFLQEWQVSGTIEAVAKYGRASEWDMRKLHALRAFKVDVEFELLDNTASAAGATTATARELKGIPGAAVDGGVTATAVSTSTERAPISEPMLNAALQDMWTAGGNPNKVIVGGFVKRGISGFVGAGAGRPIVNDNGDRIASNVIDVYESDFGRLDVAASRHTNPGSQVLFFENELLSKAWLRPPFTETPPKDGDRFPGVVVGEMTLEYLNPNGVGRITRVQSA